MSGTDHYCYVQLTTSGFDPAAYATNGEIKCRTAVDYDRTPGDQELIVFASTYEESVCEFGDCLFTYMDSSLLPEITDISVEYDETLGHHKLKIIGTGITDASVDTIDILIGGKEQEVVSVDSVNGIEVKITDIDSGLNPASLEVYLEVGVP